MESNSLPKDGTRVTAMTYESEEHDRQAEEVEGVLTTTYVEALDYTQCWVDDIQVDPATVKPKGKT